MADPKAAPPVATTAVDADIAAVEAEMARRGLSEAPPAVAATDAPVVAPADAPAAPGQVQDTGTTFIEGFLNTAGRVVKDLGIGVIEQPQAIARGALSAVEETAKGASRVGEFLDEKLGVGKSTDLGTTGNETVDEIIGYALRPLDAVAKGAGALKDAVGKPTSVTGSITEGLAQFGVGMLGAGRAFKTVGVAAPVGAKGVIVQGAAKGGIADGVVFDPLADRLSNLAQDNGFDTALTRYLMAKPTDGHAEGAFKNVIEGLMLGGVAETMIRGSARAIKLYQHGDVAGARKAAIKFDDDFTQIMRELDEPRETITGVRPDPADVPVPSTASAAADPAAAAKGVDAAKVIDVPEVKVDGTAPQAAPHDAPAPFEMPAGIADDAPVTPENLTLIRDAAKGRVPQAEIDALVAKWQANKATTGANVRVDMADVARAKAILAAHPAGKVVAPPRFPNVTDETAKRVADAFNARWHHGHDVALTSDIFNMTRFTDGEELHAMITAVEPHITAAIRKRMGGNADGARTFAQTEKTAASLAETLGVDPNSIRLMLDRDGINALQLDSRMLLYRKFMQTIVTQAADRAAVATRTGADPVTAAATAAEALHGARIAAQVIAQFKGVQTNVARAFSGQRIKVGPSTDAAMSFKALEEQLARTGLSDADRAMLRQLSTIKDPKGLRRYLEASYSRRAADSFVEYYINALLSGPKTHIVNFISSGANTAYLPMERLVAGVLPGGVGGREALHRVVDEYHGLMSSMWDSIKVAKKALSTGTPVLDEAGQSAAERAGTDRNAISAHRWGLSRDIYNVDGSIQRTQTTPVVSWMVDGIGQAVNIPSRLLMTQDEMFKQMNYRSFLFTEASAEARARGIKGTDRSKFIAEKMDAGFEANGVGNNKEALQRAREVTFTQDLEYGIGHWLQQGVGRHPMLRLVVPFVRTPTNLIRWTWQHTPLVNHLQKQFADDIAAGGQRASEARAKTVMGGTMYAMATYLAMNDHITGGGPLDPNLRRAKEATGWQANSIKTKDGKYVSFNRGDPFFMPFAIAADLVDMAGHMKDDKLDAISGAMVTALAKNLSSKTYMQGITSLFDSVGDYLSGRSAGGLDLWAARLAGNVVVPSIIANFKGEDEAQREVLSVMDAIRNRLPDNFLGLSNKGTKSLPASYNVFGEKVAPSAFIGPDQWSPLAERQHKNDPIADQLVEVMQRVDHAFARPSYLLSDSKVDLRHVKTDDGKNAYERLNELIGTVNGGVKKGLETLMRSPGYTQAGYGDKDFPMSPGSRLYQVNIVLQAHREAARETLLEQNPKLMALYMQEKTRALTTGTQGTQPQGFKMPGFLESIIGK